MNRQRLKRAYLFACAMILGFGLPAPSAAQETAPIPKITPLWTVTENFCPPDVYCGQRWQLAADDEHLFVYIVTTSTMYVYSKGQDKAAIYPILRSSQELNFSFDYFPVNEHIILYSDHLNKNTLTQLNLLTGESHVLGSEIVVQDCRNQLLQYDGASDFFYYLPTFHSLLICRKTRYDDVYSPNFISTVDLKTGQLTDVAYLGDTDYSYINVIGGRDGSVYLEPGPSNISPNRTRLILRWNSGASTWDKIEFLDSSLDNNNYRSPGFVGVDTQSSLYFESDFDTDRKQRLIITKVNPTTKAAQVFKEDQLGWNPELIGLDAAGQLIILNRMTVPSSKATVEVNVISRYEFDTPDKVK